MKITRTDNQKRPYTIQIDRCDLALYHAHKWQRHTKGLIRYPSKDDHRGSVFLHRAIMGVGPELYVVHRNGDKFDCRRENLEVITWQEQRDRKRVPRKPYFNRRSRTGALVGVTIQKHVHRWTNGSTSTYHCANACFSYQLKVYTKRFSVEVLGEHEAKRRALEWRVGKIREHGMEPNLELLAMLTEETEAAEANPYMRQPKPLKTVKVKPPKAPRTPRMILPKAPEPPRTVKVKVPKVKIPKTPKAPKEAKPKKVSRVKRRPPVAPRPVQSATVPCTITDLLDGIVSVEHHTLRGGKYAELLLEATDLHFYEQRVWQITGDGLLVSGLGRDQIRLHRLIVGAVPGERVVFRDGNTFDFRRDNLVLGGMCRNVIGLTSHGIYPSYKGKGPDRILRGVRAVIILPGQGTASSRKAYREFSFEKYGEQEAKRRAYALCVESRRANGLPDDPGLLAKLEGVTASNDNGNRPVAKRSASFFRLMSVGGALSK